MAVPFDPDEIDNLDEGVLAGVSRKQMADLQEKLLATLDDLEADEPDINTEEDAYDEWDRRIRILQDLIDAIDIQLEEN